MSDQVYSIFSDYSRNTTTATKRTRAMSVGSSVIDTDSQLLSINEEPPCLRPRLETIDLNRFDFQQSERLRHQARRNNLPSERQMSIRAANRTRNQERRSSLSAEQLALARSSNRERNHERRNSLSAEQLALARSSNGERNHERRNSLSAEQLALARFSNRERNHERRNSLSAEQFALARSSNRERNRERRNNLSNEQRSLIRTTERQRHLNRRDFQPIALKSFDDHPDSKELLFSCGPLNNKCSKCEALHFEKETHDKENAYSSCCQKGKVVLEPIQVHKDIETLMKNEHEHSQNFMSNILQFNSSLAFASMGAAIAPPPGHGPYCYNTWSVLPSNRRCGK